MLRELCRDIWNADGFERDFSLLLREEFSQSTRAIHSGDENEQEDDGMYRRLIRAASIFAQAGNHEQRDAAYRIAVSFCRNSNPLRTAALHIFEKLGNFPAIEFGFKDGSLLLGQDLRLASLFLNHLYRNRVTVGDRSLSLTNFQRRLWDALTAGKSVVVSAPTSAGKSFIVQNYILNSILTGTCRIACYVVPSRALINQVSNDLVGALRGHENVNCRVVTVPSRDERLGDEKVVTVYVLTQERLHLLLDSCGDLPLDILIVDEAQGLSDGGRGVLLYSAISRATKASKSVQQILICPFADVEKSFSAIFPRTNFSVLQEDEGVVAQNLIRVEIGREPSSQVELYLLREKSEIFLGRTGVPISLIGNNSVAALALAFGSEAANLIYAGGPARCEDIARMLMQAADSKRPMAEEVEVLSQFFEKAVHPKFLLASTIRHGIGFHYGRLPSLVRLEIERAFSAGLLRYLVTTSTLLHGVNLPAKNLFIDKPVKGDDEPLSGPEFWNLVGRAGRLGKEFEGNIFLPNMSSWSVDLTKMPRKYEVRSALERQVVDNSSEFIQFLTDFEVVSGSKQEVENSATKIFLDYVNGSIEETLESFGASLRPDVRRHLLEALEKLRRKVDLDSLTVQKNPTVSVAVQQRLKEYFVATILTKGPNRVIPLHPLAGDEVWKNYLMVFKRIHTYIERKPSQDKSHTFFSRLAIQWMRGYPLPRLIESSIQYEKKKKSETSSAAGVNIPSIIRKTLKLIEEDLRFRYVKYLSCYASVLSEALADTGHGHRVKSIPNLALYMEMGASSASMLSLLELGVSRITSSMVVERMLDKNMAVGQVRTWLESTDMELLELPRPSLNELLRLKESSRFV